MKEEVTDRFLAYADEGTSYRVTEMTQIVDTSTLKKQDSVRGLKRYVLEDGRALNPIGNDGKTFEIFDAKQKLTRK
jgi:hypothetical protein